MKTSSRNQKPALCVALTKARARSGLTQRELARRLGRVHSFVARVEAGERRVDVREFLELSRALQFDPRAMIAELEAAYLKER